MFVCSHRRPDVGEPLADALEDGGHADVGVGDAAAHEELAAVIVQHLDNEKIHF